MYSSTSTSTSTLIALLIALTASTSDAFATQRPQRYSAVSMNLIPDQASDLVAASNAAYSPRDDDDDDDNQEHDVSHHQTAPAASNKQTPTPTRAFAARVFSLPSSLIKRHPHPKSEGLPASTTSSTSPQDFVMFPVIGFQYVRDSPDHCTALPTISVASCRLPIRNEPVYGWFGPVSFLENEN
jgi:hypothetical protein